VVRVLRGIKATKEISAVLLQQRARNTFLAVSLLALLLVVTCSIAELHFETVPEANIHTAADAVWWSFATITTVGYGDRYPVTPEGRVVAVMLMCAGVGLFGTFSGFVAAWFLGPANANNDSEMKAVRAELAEIRQAIERQSAHGAA
jgi:voltage-gated potassium channel